MSFLKVPQEVLQNLLFWYLGYNDVLRMRRVSKYTKKAADDHIRSEKRMSKTDMAIHVESDHPRSLSAFLELDFPFKNVHIKADWIRYYYDQEEEDAWGEFFEHEEMPIFLEKYGKTVTHLGVAFMQLPFWRPKEIQFYNSFSSLESLYCKHVDTRSYEFWSEKTGSCLVPASLTRLKRLHLPKVQTERVKRGLEERLYRIWRFFNGVSSQLDYFTHPSFPDCGQIDLYFESCGAFTWVKDMIDGRPAHANLKIYDLVNFEEEDYKRDVHSEHFMSLCSSCFSAGVKLKNVDTRLLSKYDISDEDKLAVANTVLSLKDGLDLRVFKYDLPLLESIDIKTRLSDLPGMGQLRRNPPNWPQLQEITLKINTPDEEDGGEIEQFDKLEFLLFGEHRPNMKELSMEWDIMRKEKAHLYKIPSPTSLTASMCNLTTLEIIGCLATNQFFVTLWTGLVQLETVRITSCENLGDEGFIGDNPKEPVFLKLQNLKQVQLCGLDKITDALLYNVVRHIPLKSLALYSSEKSRLTLAAIEALNTSLLAQSIVDLYVSLRNFTAEEVSKVVSQFRSSQMC